MSGQSKPPKSPFNFASGAWDKDQAAKYDQEQGLNDKDNAAKRFDPPSQNQNPAPNLAPPGMSGSKGGRPQLPETDDLQVEFTPEGYANPETIDLTNDGTLIEGELGGDTSFLVKPEYPADVPDGECRITRLTLIEDGVPVVHFDGAWDLKAKTEEQQEMVRSLEDRFGEIYPSHFKSFTDLNPDQENEIER